MAEKASRFILIFALLWSVMVLAVDWFTARTFIRQGLSWRYEATEGRILESEITTHQSDGTTYGAKVDYEFTVHGRRYRSDRVRYGQGSDSDGTWARETVGANPAGAVRPVYYDAGDPSRSVLQRGIGGQDWFLALFLTPFNAVMVFLWGVVFNRFRAPAPLGGARAVTQPGRIVVYMDSMPRAAWVLMAFGLVSFGGIFLVGVTQGLSPKAHYVWLTWGVAAAAALAAWRMAARPGEPYMIIDAGRGVLSLPKGQFNTVRNWAQWSEWKKAGRPALDIPLERIRGASASRRITTSGEGDVTTYVAALRVEEPGTGSTREYDLGSWMFAQGAEAFAAWLREILGLKAEQ